MKDYIENIRIINRIAPAPHFYVLQKFISILAYRLADLLPPMAIAGCIAAITEKNFNGIWIYVAFYMGANFLYYILFAWTMYVYTMLADHYHNTIQKLLFLHVAENHTIFDKFSQGKVNDTIADDVRYVVDTVDATLHVLATTIQMSVIFLIFALNNIFVAAIAISFTIIYMVLMSNNSKTISKYYDGTRKYEDKTLNILSQLLSNLKQVKSLNIMPNISVQLDKNAESWRTQFFKKRFAMVIRRSVMPNIIYGCEIMMYILLGYLVVNGSMTIDKLILLTSYFSSITRYVEDLLTHALNLSQYTVRIHRIKNILDYTGDGMIDYGDIENDYIKGSVAFSHVTYFADGKEILKNISFKAYPNEITAIVGKPGSGKTTVLNLLYRLSRIKSGSILLDDESIYNYTKKVYASNVSGVFQAPFTFRMSIADNLAIIDPNRKHQEAACRRVGIHKIIAALPKGYNTVIDDAHEVLTLYQLQLLAIARALLTKAEVLLFDEVEFDSDTAADLAEVIKDLKEDHTILVVTAYDEILKTADRFVIMKDGKVTKNTTKYSDLN